MTRPCLIDAGFSRRLERAEGRAASRFVEARARQVPDAGAEWLEVAGAYLLFDQPASPVTQTFGLGLSGLPTPAEMERIDGFFAAHGGSAVHEVSPLADPAMLPLLAGRGYRPVELTSILYQPLAGFPAPGPPDRVAVRESVPAECDLWARTAADGWRDTIEHSEELFALMRLLADAGDVRTYFAEIEGQPVATGAMSVQDGVALLAGAATLPEWRNRGAQRALLAHRLGVAARAGCDLAMMGAAPGSASQRNAQRQGFHIAYTRIKWGR